VEWDLEMVRPQRARSRSCQVEEASRDDEV